MKVLDMFCLVKMKNMTGLKKSNEKQFNYNK